MKLVRKNIYSKKQKYFFFCFIILFLFTYSCRTSKVPEGKALLTKNIYKIEGNKKEKQNLNTYVKQKPNQKFIALFPVGLYLNSFSNVKYDSLFDAYKKVNQKLKKQKLLDSFYLSPTFHMPEEKGKSKWLARWVYNLSAKPVIVDNELAEYSAKNIENFYKTKGFWKAKVSYEIKNNTTLIKKSKKQKIIYKIQTNKPILIGDLSYDIPNQNILAIYKKNLRDTYLKKGNHLDGYIIDKEYNRIETLMRNNGYINFNQTKDELIYEVDTTLYKNNIPMTLKVKKSKIGIKDSSQIKFKQSYYNNVIVSFDKNQLDITKCEYDTLAKIYIYNPTKKYKNIVFSNATSFKKGNLFRNKDFITTNRNLNSLNNFIVEEIKPKIINDTLVDISLLLKPKLKYDLDLSLDAFLSGQSSFGFIPGLKLSSRNIFGGAENFDISYNGTIGTLTNNYENSKLFNAYEHTLQSNLTIPRWWLPFKLGKKIPPNYLPSTNFKVRVSFQKNIGLDRFNITSQINYILQPNNTINHKFSLFNLQYINILNPENYFLNRYEDTDNLVYFLNLFQDEYPNYEVKDSQNFNESLTDIYSNYPSFISKLATIDPSFEKTITSIYLNFKRVTDNILINSFIYEFNYNELIDKEKENPFNILTKVELAGNLFSALENVFNNEKETLLGKETTKIFGTSYSQFFKINFDIRKYWEINSKNKIVARAFFGVGIPYGNSLFLPFDRRYYMGGANDLRAWRPPNIDKSLGLGPGDKQENISNRGFGNMKLLFNLEWRYPISGNLEGALFTDAGNIWETDNKFDNTFDFGDFYQQLAIGSGIGFRYNISYFILRFDFAYKIYDPSLSLNNRWVGNKITFLQPTIQFALGFPF